MFVAASVLNKTGYDKNPWKESDLPYISIHDFSPNFTISGTFWGSPTIGSNQAQVISMVDRYPYPIPPPALVDWQTSSQPTVVQPG